MSPSQTLFQKSLNQVKKDAHFLTSKKSWAKLAPAQLVGVLVVGLSVVGVVASMTLVQMNSDLRQHAQVVYNICVSSPDSTCTGRIIGDGCIPVSGGLTSGSCIETFLGSQSCNCILPSATPKPTLIVKATNTPPFSTTAPTAKPTAIPSIFKSNTPIPTLRATATPSDPIADAGCNKAGETFCYLGTLGSCTSATAASYQACQYGCTVLSTGTAKCNPAPTATPYDPYAAACQTRSSYCYLNSLGTCTSPNTATYQNCQYGCVTAGSSAYCQTAPTNSCIPGSTSCRQGILYTCVSSDGSYQSGACQSGYCANANSCMSVGVTRAATPTPVPAKLPAEIVYKIVTSAPLPTTAPPQQTACYYVTTYREPLNGCQLRGYVGASAGCGADYSSLTMCQTARDPALPTLIPAPSTSLPSGHCTPGSFLGCYENMGVGFIQTCSPDGNGVSSGRCAGGVGCNDSNYNCDPAPTIARAVDYSPKLPSTSDVIPTATPKTVIIKKDNVPVVVEVKSNFVCSNTTTLSSWPLVGGAWNAACTTELSTTSEGSGSKALESTTKNTNIGCTMFGWVPGVSTLCKSNDDSSGIVVPKSDQTQPIPEVQNADFSLKDEICYSIPTECKTPADPKFSSPECADYFNHPVFADFDSCDMEARSKIVATPGVDGKFNP